MGSSLQFAQVVGAVVGYCMAFEPCRQILPRIEAGRARRQKCNLEMFIQTVEIVEHAVHALKERAHALDRPQFSAKSMGCWALQEGGAYLRQLHPLQLCWSAALRYRT